MAGSGPRAVITGLGAVSGFGPGAEALWRGLASGRSAIRPAPSLAAAGIAEVASYLPGEDPLAPGERAIPMALAAAAEAVADAGGVSSGARLAVALGTTLGGIGAFLDVVRGESPSARGWGWNGPAEAIARAHGAGGPVAVTSVACVSGNAALGMALDLVRSGRATQVIAGGVDALSHFVTAGFASLKALDPAPCRPFDRDRRGLNLGEGACFLVVEEEEHARARGARIRGFLAGYGAASDANHMTGPDRTGRGAARAMNAALVDAGVEAGAIDFVSAHGTATLFNDLMEAKALHAVLGAAAPRIPVNSIKSAIGHTLGAAGAFEALLCVRTMEEGLIAPTVGHLERDPEIDLDIVAGAAREAQVRVALSTSSGFGGLNAALVIRAAEPGDYFTVGTNPLN
ncbi:MAG: beta-ketoacyl-[acyl-carrier-protein] synthase family protein [Myxococcales bacterium]|nr:beta-ketoacyl-[acyl-carrier-protein] synthase family protein [Myxococcales bacterium]